jgi:dTDP-3-amino-3,4,6-trideoxy-alpha-D-glucose transaminase
MGAVASHVRVPFLDLGPSHAVVKDEILSDFGGLIETNAFINGPHVAAFENAWAAHCGTAKCVGVASGLDALRLGLIAAGIERGDEVIVPANTFAATFEGVTQAGGRPVPVDVSAADYNLDFDAAAAAMTPRTRFVMPVHLYGQCCDMRALRALADRYDLTILEDACQAHGAIRDGVGAGTVGRASAFSFYPGKNLGAMGDAGALVTDDQELAGQVVALREHGQRGKYRHDLEGYTARLDTVQAIVLLHKLRYLDIWNAERRALAAGYTERLAGLGDLVLPPVPSGSNPVWHLYVVRTERPLEFAEFLVERGIGTGRHYPEPPHRSRAYEWLGYGPGSLPVTETIAAQVLSLPIFPGMTVEQLETVVEAVREYFTRA